MSIIRILKTGLLIVYRINIGGSSFLPVEKMLDIIFIPGNPPKRSIPNGSLANYLGLGLACGIF